MDVGCGFHDVETIPTGVVADRYVFPLVSEMDSAMDPSSLEEADRRAIDVLMNDLRLQNSKNQYPVATPAVSIDSVKNWEKLLAKLDHFVVPEPPQDLVERTLVKIRGTPPITNAEIRITATDSQTQ